MTREDDGHAVAEPAFMRLMAPITAVSPAAEMGRCWQRGSAPQCGGRRPTRWQRAPPAELTTPIYTLSPSSQSYAPRPVVVEVYRNILLLER